MFILKNLVSTFMKEVDRDENFSGWIPSDTPQLLNGIIDKRWIDLYSDIHGVAYCVHPAFIDPCHEQGKNMELMQSMLVLSDKLLGADKGAEARRQWREVFKKKCGFFKDQRVLEEGQRSDPVSWWKMYGSSTCPELTDLACKVLSQPVSASACERVWSAYKRIHTESRNRMSHDVAKKLLQVYFNERVWKANEEHNWEMETFDWVEG
jgi:hypothetical protein